MGCFKLDLPDDYLIIKNSSIFNCFKFCHFFNYSKIATGENCFCLNDVNETSKIIDSYCQFQNSYDQHFYGKTLHNGVYKIRSKILIRK